MRFSSITMAVFGFALVAAPSIGVSAQDAAIVTGRETNGKAQVEVMSLTRTEGDTVTIRFAVKNDNSRDMSLVLGNMKLLDLTGRKSYGAGLTSECRIPAGDKRICWAIFAAPGGNTRTLNVQFYENFDLIPVPFAN